MNSRNFEGHEIILNSIGQSSDIVSNGDLPIVNDAIRQISSVLDIDSQEQFMNSQDRLNDLLSELEIEVARVRKIIGYNYAIDNYQNKLLANNSRIDRLKRNFFVDNNILIKKVLSLFDGANFPNNGIGKLCTSLLSLNSFAGFNDIIKHKIYHDYLEDLIYEAMIISLVNYGGRRYKIFKTFDAFSQVIFLSSFSKDIFLYNSKQDISLIKPESVINENEQFKILTLKFIAFGDGSDISYDYLYDLISIAASNGLKCIEFSRCNFLGDLMDNPPNIITFFDFLGRSGIKSLILRGNFLGDKIFYNNPELLPQVFRQSGNSGIKSIQLTWSNLNIGFEGKPDKLINLFEIIGNSGLRYVDLSGNSFLKVIETYSMDKQEQIRRLLNYYTNHKIVDIIIN